MTKQKKISITCPRCKQTRTVQYYTRRRTDLCAKCSRALRTPSHLKRYPEWKENN